VSTVWPRQQLVQSPHLLPGWNIQHCTACGAIRYTTLCQALTAAATKALAATKAQTQITGIVLVIQTDWARVFEGSFPSARVTGHPTAAIATAFFPTDFLVSSSFPVKGHPLPLWAGAHARAQILTVLGDPP
jgi:hypothetical protein